MNKKYQVFVSSTYEDLLEERQEVIHALLELDCIPAGMELFPAANEDQWTLIKRVIDDCDYYLVIAGGRYGSIAKDGVGYTEKEFDYANEKKKPIIGFLHKDLESLTVKKTEKSAEGKLKLIAFREKIQSRVCKYWSTKEDLGSVVSRSLVQLIKTNPATGWVKADAALLDFAKNELLELKEKNRELEETIKQIRKEPPKGFEEYAQGKDFFEIKLNYCDGGRSIRYATDLEHPYRFPTSWNELFYIISPVLLSEASDEDIKRVLNSYYYEIIKRDVIEPNRHLHYVKINEEKFHTIIVQFKVLGYIAQSSKQRSVKDNRTYWTLTPYGDEVMTRLRAIKKKTVIKKVKIKIEE